ncbi:hypothetical protein CEXT_409071 [Caerostris extrusa]|uniref:Uncharacterized protein n=1 Tax=Caerostris extrusa TaxID=172846 RepID=A0AAV4XVL9_CAEEX|nr:hypothetical protein CEXT_409071 [Caerostris extrusa]
MQKISDNGPNERKRKNQGVGENEGKSKYLRFQSPALGETYSIFSDQRTKGLCSYVLFSWKEVIRIPHSLPKSLAWPIEKERSILNVIRVNGSCFTASHISRAIAPTQLRIKIHSYAELSVWNRWRRV